MSFAGIMSKHHHFQSFLMNQRPNLPALQRKGGLEVGGNLQPSHKTQDPLCIPGSGVRGTTPGLSFSPGGWPLTVQPHKAPPPAPCLRKSLSWHQP